MLPVPRCMGSLLFAAALLTACGHKSDGPAPAASSSAAPSGSVSAGQHGGYPHTPGPPSPLSIVLEHRGQLLLSGLEGGVLVTDAAHTRLARAAAGGELSSEPMPEGLPEGPGRILRAAGRSPGPVWLVYEKLRDDGKVESNPLFRLGKEGLKKYADDWKPALAPWSKHRLLAASTSSGKLKIKVLEPSLPAPPADLPSVHLDDASCEQTLRVEGLAALGSGEVFAAGTCKPDTAAGAGPSPSRYVVIRWPAATPPSSTRAPDAGEAADGGAEDRPGLVDVIPGVSTDLAHAVLHARSPSDVWVAGQPRSGPSRVFHFDGATWAPVALPPGYGAEPGSAGRSPIVDPGVAAVRGLAATADGTVWMATERALWRRAAAGTWEEVPPPARAGDAGGTWEMLEVVAPDGHDVWIAARRTAADGPRDLILRARAAPAIVRWE